MCKTMIIPQHWWRNKKLHSPFWELNGPVFKKLNSPSQKVALCQVWLKLAKWFWRKLLNFVNVFLLLCYYLPLKKSGHFIWKITLIPFTHEYIVPSLVNIDEVVLEKKTKMWKVYDNNNNNRQWTNFDKKSSLQPSVQVT